ncbi:MAG: hypothetical protein PHD21_07835, partial [Flavobacteriales bacterium]|nr:hypothetical protein [Flavobacteriales bacterium]
TTASQPAINKHLIGSRRCSFEGLDGLEEIIKDRELLSSQLRRVKFEVRNQKQDSNTIANELMSLHRVLCVVNTRKDALELYRKTEDNDGVIHLSRSMCSAHIMEKIEDIKRTLSSSEKPLRVISTQLIEAGVDIDFPVVFRQICGLDSILQAAGRCNREGKNKEMGRVVVFSGEKLPSAGHIRIGSQCFNELIDLNPDVDLLSPKTMELYFELLYSNIQNFDSAGIKELLYDDAQR